ncbi:hypothetical protein B1R94_26645 [Mycolicibacterium litorale]|nr:hypothetical protein B1R94_26645 [Mycolicibacterium litorale]
MVTAIDTAAGGGGVGVGNFVSWPESADTRLDAGSPTASETVYKPITATAVTLTAAASIRFVLMPNTPFGDNQNYRYGPKSTVTLRN